MSKWWNERMVAFDLETTGVDPEEARIVTAAIALCSGGERTESQTWLADPGIEIPDEAAGVHGITTDIARRDGRPAREVIAEVIETLAIAAGHGWPLVIYNARYDLTVLDREARRHGLATLSERVPLLLVIDPMIIDKWLDRYRPGSRKLDAMCAHYGFPLEGAHDASFDAIAAARGAWCLGARGRVVRRTDWPKAAAEARMCHAQWDRVHEDLPALYEAQIGWAVEQALGLANYFRDKGQYDDAESVRTEWPLVPFREPARV